MNEGITYATREEWLKARAAYVTSTESAALFGMSPYLTAYELAVQKTGKINEEIEENERMRWGIRMQDSIAQGIADDHGVSIDGLEWMLAVHPTCTRMAASFDYRILDAKPSDSPLYELVQQFGPGLLEIKNVDALVYRDWPEHDAPDHIEIQVQHQLEVSGLEWCVLGVLVGGNRTELYTRMRDPAVGASIVVKVTEFWKNLEAGVLPPAILPEDADIIIRLYGYAEPNKVFDGNRDETLIGMCEQYTELQRFSREADEAQKSMKAKILQHIGDAERAVVPGYTLSAAMVAPTEVKSYTRRAFRNFRLLARRSDS